MSAFSRTLELLGAGQPAFFFDLDGTLADIAARPEDVRVPGPVIALLDRLSTAVDGAVAILSGRSLDQVDALLSPLRLPAAGVHGGEIRLPGGRHVKFEASPYIRSVLKGGVASLSLPEGAWLEDKQGMAFALHYRQCPEAGACLLDAAQRIAGQTHGAYSALAGDHVVELRPATHSKGTALRRLMETEPFRDRVPVVLGDDHTDEDAFEEAMLWEGFAISVGPRMPTCASLDLDDPSCLHAWLSDVTEEMERTAFARWMQGVEAA